MPNETAYISGAFQIGNRVMVGSRSTPSNWAGTWEPDMDKCVGMIGTVIDVHTQNGYRVRIDTSQVGNFNFWFPNTSLQYAAGVPVTTVSPVAKPSAKKKRVRVGPGPWDSAPCTHLRWNLMGFFREKLALVKTKVTIKTADGSMQEVYVTQMEVACTKCKTRMTLQAK